MFLSREKREGLYSVVLADWSMLFPSAFLFSSIVIYLLTVYQSLFFPFYFESAEGRKTGSKMQMVLSTGGDAK